MGLTSPRMGQSFDDWVLQLSNEDITALLRAHYENEYQHMLDMDADAQVQEELDGRA